MRAFNTDQISIWPMLAGCLVIYCVMSIYIASALTDHALDLLFYFTYMAVACSFLPLPTTQIVMDYAYRYDLVLISVLGGIAFCISMLIDYSLVTLALRNGKIGRIKETRAYRYVERIFYKCPSVMLMIAALTPIPFEPVKLVACASRYNRAKFLMACLISRTFRYYIVGILQRELLHIPGIYLYGSIVALVIIELIRRLVKRLSDPHRNRRETESSENTTA